MKKTIVLSFILMCMFFCSSCQKENEEINTPETIDTLTIGQIEEISIPLIEKSLNVYDKIMGLSFTREDETTTENGLVYYKTTELNSKNEVWALANTVFTEDSAKRLFTKNIDGDENYTPKFIEKNGSLYVTRAFNITKSDRYNVKSIEVLENSTDAFVLLVNFHYTHSKLYFTKTASGWRLDNSVVEGEKEYIGSIEATDTESIFAISDDGKLTLSANGLTESHELSMNDAKAIFIPLLERCVSTYECIHNGPSWSLGKITPDFLVNKTEYYFVEYPELETMNDVWDDAYGAYTEECAQRIFSSRLNPENESARYLETNGKLYFQPYSRGYATSYDLSSAVLVEQYKNVLVFNVDEYLFDEFKKTATFVLQKTSLGWRMANGFDETLELSTYTQFNGMELKNLSEGVTFNYAPKNQDVFPTSFNYNGAKITVNAPVFTGLKTKNAYTYKEFFAFENSQVVVSVLAKDNNGNDTLKHLLLDKSGKVIDTDFDRHSTVSNRAAISKYPEGVEVVQTGEAGNYEQYLATTDGEILSEKFDEIGFFNDGIALARRENKIGFISIDGETLLEPSIEIDDVRYTPDYYRCYQVKHITDDAFIVSIDGQLAIITLERAQ